VTEKKKTATEKKKETRKCSKGVYGGGKGRPLPIDWGGTLKLSIKKKKKIVEGLYP